MNDQQVRFIDHLNFVFTILIRLLTYRKLASSFVLWCKVKIMYVFIDPPRCVPFHIDGEGTINMRPRSILAI